MTMITDQWAATTSRLKTAVSDSGEHKSRDKDVAIAQAGCQASRLRLLVLQMAMCWLVASVPLVVSVAESAPPFAVVLGIAQDGGVPQAGAFAHPGWNDPSARHRIACLGIVDPERGQRWLIDATPDFREQLYTLHKLAERHDTTALASRPAVPPVDGILLTHAHIGHYTGLMFLGHESMGAQRVPVHAMPRLCAFLQANGPWSQLVRYRNIVLVPLEAARVDTLNSRLSVTPFLVPHRQEFSEVVGYRVQGPSRALLYLPDVDSWEELDESGHPIEAWIASVDVAYLDATFYADGEIPGRDMSGFPHPFITHSMERFATLPAKEKSKIRFIHLNHTNPALIPNSEAWRAIESAGFHLAVEGERVDL